MERKGVDNKDLLQVYTQMFDMLIEAKLYSDKSRHESQCNKPATDFNSLRPSNKAFFKEEETKTC